MGNSSSNLDKLNKAANQNASSATAHNSITHFNKVYEIPENKIDEQTEKKEEPKRAEIKVSWKQFKKMNK